MRKISKRSAVIVGVTVVALGGGAAWAAFSGWDIEGEGKANGKAAQIKKLTASTTFTDNLYPGLTTDITTTMKNPNEFPVQLTGEIAVVNATVTPAGEDATACAAGLKEAGMFTTTFPGTPTIAAGDEAASVPGTVTIGNIPQACSAKTVKIDYSFNAKSLPEAS
ncbi:hypothetical protein OHA21_34570 [Actinoplanes sp. NBC_00393]|uniref:hypothetical protein n=1 Tax=Actinoplanes sp. NBC_00393 TaxID=2975953 RepID=UPI002E1A2058